MNRSSLATTSLLACLLAVAGEAHAAGPVAAGATCPDASQAARIASAYAGATAPMPFMAAAKLGLPEVVVAGGLPAALGHGVDGKAFQAVWQSLGAWPDAVVMIRKGANIFEIRTRVPTGKPSTRSKLFNLDHDAALSGHLRPDLFTAIHAIQAPGAEGFMRGVFFYDDSGESVLGVFVPPAEAPPAAQVAAFDKTLALLKTLPPRCPRPAG
jgi:putative heme iron utilization protein